MEKIIDIKKRVGAAALAAVTAGVMAASPVMAFADEPGEHVTAAAYRAAAPSVELLGADSVEETNQFVNTSDWYNWSTPKYQLFASTYNSNPSCYLYNLAHGSTDSTVTAVLHTKRTGAGAGPNQALGTEGKDPDIRAMANVVVGDGNGADASDNVVAYDATDYDALIQSMYDIAAALDTVADDEANSLSLRYGSATAIAEQYEHYIRGTLGYVQEHIANGTAKQTVALVTGYSLDSNGVATYTLLSNAASGQGDGTAAKNRYLETVSSVADNYADANYTTTATAAQLKSLGLVMVGGQSGSSTDSIVSQLQKDEVNNLFYVEANGSNGSAYGTVMNSVENAQNIARILGCLYPDLIDQDNFICYYYDVFYHINNDLVDVNNNSLDADNDFVNDSFEYVIDQAMDGVYNYDNKSIEWKTSNASSYSRASVQSIIDEGWTYYQSLNQ